MGVPVSEGGSSAYLCKDCYVGGCHYLLAMLGNQIEPSTCTLVCGASYELQLCSHSEINSLRGLSACRSKDHGTNKGIVDTCSCFGPSYFKSRVIDFAALGHALVHKCLFLKK